MSLKLSGIFVHFDNPSHRQRHRNVPTVQGAVLKCRWQFNSKRGAILLMHRTRITRVPDAFFKTPGSLHIPVLKGKGKVLVYQVWNCPGYFMYLCNRCAYSCRLVYPKSILFHPVNEKVAVRLQTDVTPPATPGVNINPAANISWFTDGCTGIQQHAYQPIPAYTPLFCLRSIRRPLLGGFGKES